MYPGAKQPRMVFQLPSIMILIMLWTMCVLGQVYKSIPCWIMLLTRWLVFYKTMQVLYFRLPYFDWARIKGEMTFWCYSVTFGFKTWRFDDEMWRFYISIRNWKRDVWSWVLGCGLLVVCCSASWVVDGRGYLSIWFEFLLWYILDFSMVVSFSWVSHVRLY